jgi:hypothetical protein
MATPCSNTGPLLLLLLLAKCGRCIINAADSATDTVTKKKVKSDENRGNMNMQWRWIMNKNKNKFVSGSKKKGCNSVVELEIAGLELAGRCGSKHFCWNTSALAVAQHPRRMAGPPDPWDDGREGRKVGQ